MVYEGYVRIGGVEVVNSERVRGYVETAECPTSWLRGTRCESLQDALDDAPYIHSNISLAPWYDPGLPDLTGRFYGVLGMELAGLSDSTRAASITQGINDGGTIGRPRKGVREMRASVTLIAKGRDALDYGIAWLSAALDPGQCGQHSSACGTADVEFFTDCPPEYNPDDEAGWATAVSDMARYLHDTAATSGPILIETLKSKAGDFWGAVMEFTVTSERAWIYSRTRSVELPVTPTIVIQDTPYNLVTHPSAELATTAFGVAVATNYSANPSVESNATGWSVGGTTGIAPNASGSRSTELSAVGSASYKVSSTATNSGTSGVLTAFQDVDISGAPAGARFSVSIWSALVRQSGTAVLGDISVQVQWRTSGGSALRNDDIGSQPAAGGALSATGLQPPAGAATARVIIRGNVTSWSSGAVLSLFSDALAVTVP